MYSLWGFGQGCFLPMDPGLVNGHGAWYGGLLVKRSWLVTSGTVCKGCHGAQSHAPRQQHQRPRRREKSMIDPPFEPADAHPDTTTTTTPKQWPTGASAIASTAARSHRGAAAAGASRAAAPWRTRRRRGSPPSWSRRSSALTTRPRPASSSRPSKRCVLWCVWCAFVCSVGRGRGRGRLDGWSMGPPVAPIRGRGFRGSVRGRTSELSQTLSNAPNVYEPQLHSQGQVDRERAVRVL